MIKAVPGLVANKQLVDSPKRLQQTLSVDVLSPPQADFPRFTQNKSSATPAQQKKWLNTL